jgi:hypothetical protein
LKFRKKYFEHFILFHHLEAGKATYTLLKTLTVIVCHDDKGQAEESDLCLDVEHGGLPNRHEL